MNRKLLKQLQARHEQRLNQLRSQVESGEVRDADLGAVQDEIDGLISELKDIKEELDDGSGDNTDDDGDGDLADGEGRSGEDGDDSEDDDSAGDDGEGEDEGRSSGREGEKPCRNDQPRRT